MIKLKKVSYLYDDKILALKDISLSIDKGEAVALIGPNGSGKSTFMKLINGLIFPRFGSYYLREEEITHKKMQKSDFCKEFHRSFGFIFQNSDTQLFCSTVYDEVAFGARQMGMKEEEVKKRVEDLLKLLDIEKLKDRHPYNLSGGEKKKVSIACNLIFNPDILVLDEPMNGLDPKSKRFLRDFIIDLNKAGKTIICSTHDFEYVEGVFKRAIVFSDNHSIIRDGDYETILKDKKFLYDNNII